MTPMAHPRAGQTGPPRRSHRRRRRDQRLLRPDARPGQPRPTGRLRHLGPPRIQPGHRLQRRPHRRHHPGDRGIPGRPGHHRSAVHRQGHPRPLPAGLEDRDRGADRQRGDRAGRERRRLHPDAGRVPGHRRAQRRLAPNGAAGRRHRGHPVPQPAPRRRLQVQPAARRAGRLRRHQRDRRPGQRAAGRPVADPADAVRAGRRRRPPLRLPRHLLRGPGERPQPARRPRGRGAHRRRPDGRGQRAVLGLHRRAPRHRSHGDQPQGRPPVGLHDPGHRRQDPDGLLLAERDGQPDRQQGRLRHLHRQRRRLRPARHRHPRLRPDQPQRLPGRGHPVPLRPPRRLAPRRRASARRWCPPR